MKCLSVSSTITAIDIIPVLIEKLRPNMKTTV